MNDLVGSHSGKSDEERAASSVVVRFRLRGGDPPAIDDASVVRWNIARPLEAALVALGLDAARIAEREVGGLTVRESGGRRELVISEIKLLITYNNDPQATRIPSRFQTATLVHERN